MYQSPRIFPISHRFLRNYHYKQSIRVQNKIYCGNFEKFSRISYMTGCNFSEIASFQRVFLQRIVPCRGVCLEFCLETSWIFISQKLFLFFFILVFHRRILKKKNHTVRYYHQKKVSRQKFSGHCVVSHIFLNFRS